MANVGANVWSAYTSYVEEFLNTESLEKTSESKLYA
jgi:hypothetical protein